MSTDYEKIRAENRRRYGTEIGRIGQMLLADRYDDRTHFLFELLQNAEDALARRRDWNGSRSVRFHLAGDRLFVRHYGEPFNEADVRGICGIAEGTKGLTEIGRFGIGFKSVYAYSSRPEVHSGNEAFAIENFVWPVAVPRISRADDETVIVIPLEDPDTARAEIQAGLEGLGARTLLFLHHVDEIEWDVDRGSHGFYVRSTPENLGDGVRRVTVLGKQTDAEEIEENWLLFSEAMESDSGLFVGNVEIAFAIAAANRDVRGRVAKITRSPLVAFFPTVVETHLGFLIQGPYRTTPSRDNVPRLDEWNRRCVRQTAAVIVQALRWFRDQDLLTPAVLETLPLDPDKFGENTMLAPLFETTKEALRAEPLLPCSTGEYASGSSALLSRTSDLRELLTKQQLQALYDDGQRWAWLSGDVSQDRTPELRSYLMQEIDVPELTPESFVFRLDAEFLENQSDRWILKLYEFLHGKSALSRRIHSIPLLRLEDREHVTARDDDSPNAYLPSTMETGFPTVRRSVSCTDKALAFLRALGLSEPAAVDDVIQNVLPRLGSLAAVTEADYASDIGRIVAAFATDSKAQRERLIAALRQSPFVWAVRPDDPTPFRTTPDQLYIPTQRLKELFAGVPGVEFVDDGHSGLRGEDIREVLEACGAVRHLRPVKVTSLPTEERQELRAKAGHSKTSGQNDRIVDWTLQGLEELLDSLAGLDDRAKHERAEALWDELSTLEDRRGKGIFTGEYTWTHYGSYRATFPAAFVRSLNATAWVPDADATLKPPHKIPFESLNWKSNPFLLEQIKFRPDVIDQLAAEVGIEPGVLELLREYGVTSVKSLAARLGLSSAAEQDDDNETSDKGTTGGEALERDGHRNTSRSDSRENERGSRTTSGGREKGSRIEPAGEDGKKDPRGPFMSYVALEPDANEADPDGLDQEARMRLEEKAIEDILESEPGWKRMPPNNPGYDLSRADSSTSVQLYCEVKAMSGTLHDRPVGLSRRQFECAQKHGSNYWLYIVERAGDQNSRIVRIQDPAGRARTFTLDSGWIQVAELEPI